MRRRLIDRQLLGSSLEAKIFHHPVLIEEDDKAIHFMLFPRVLKYENVGEIGFFDREDRGVLAKISIDKDVSVKLLLNTNRRSKVLKNFALGGRTDLDFFRRIVPDFGAHIDPSDAATTRQGHQKRDENKCLI